MWYSNWQLWSTVVAFLALILSQIPPVKLLFKRGQLIIKKHTSILIHHSLGTPSLNIFINIKNVGGRTVNIGSLKLKLERDGIELPLLSVGGYFSDLNVQYATMFVPFELQAQSSWAHTVLFQEKWNRTQQQKFRSISSEVRDTIVEKMKTNPLPNGELHEANSDQVKEINTQFIHNFKWLSGEYRGEIMVLDHDEKLILTDKFKFTIFETESNELRAAVDDYRFGYGIYLPNTQKQQGIWVELVR